MSIDEVMTFAEKLKGLLEKASAGPWEATSSGIWVGDSWAAEFANQRDRDFVVALVNAAPALVRLLEYLNAEPVSLRQVFYALDELDKEVER